MKYYIYKITNLVTNHFYIGCHMTKDFNDDYMGSGVLIKKAIKHHGLHNFSKEIVKECKDRFDMLRQERLIINWKLIKNPNCYNLITGGKYKTKGTKKINAKTKACKELLTNRKYRKI